MSLICDPSLRADEAYHVFISGQPQIHNEAEKESESIFCNTNVYTQVEESASTEEN